MKSRLFKPLLKIAFALAAITVMFTAFGMAVYKVTERYVIYLPTEISQVRGDSIVLTVMPKIEYINISRDGAADTIIGMASKLICWTTRHKMKNGSVVYCEICSALLPERRPADAICSVKQDSIRRK
jgi:hypothetical protein